MVTRSSLSVSFLLPILAFLAACAPAPRTITAPEFHPTPESGTVYVVQFLSVLSPESFNKDTFDTMIDDLNSGKDRAGVKWFFIIKQGSKEVNPSWLARQVYVTGEIWSYTENSGCCQTELKANARAQIFEPGKKEPTAEIVVPAESFFDHDYSTLELERKRLSERIAHELSRRILATLAHGN